jgi:hypothetical protein
MKLLLVIPFFQLTCAIVPVLHPCRLTNSRAAQMVVPAFPSPGIPRPSSAPANDETKKSWQSRLGRVSAVASILCAVDCTVLPALLVIVPALNIAGASSAGLHEISHLVAVWFVAPVGGAALTANWFQHRRNWVGVWGLSGLLLVLFANLHLPHGFLPSPMYRMVHGFHSLISLAGCALLLSSQWYSTRLLQNAGRCCDHKH